MFTVFIFFACSCVCAAEYRILVVPDNLANKPCLDTFIYEESSEFFANQVINQLNKSGMFESISVSEARDKLAKNPRLNIATRESLLRFKKEYNINYLNLKKLSQMFNTDKILLITTSADAQNYFTRRTFWDFLNIPGAAVVDPAIKLSTYAVLVDTSRDVNLWEDTFYKTISSCEYRMVANSLEPQNIQLEKVRDYSRLLAPQITSNIQLALVPKDKLNRDNIIDYSMKNLDNVYLKKVRSYDRATKKWKKETDYKIQKYKEKRAEQKAEKEAQKQEKMQQEENNINNVQTEVIEIKENENNTKNNVKKNEPKILNVSKEEYIQNNDQKKQKTDYVEPLQLKYNQPYSRMRNFEKNKTINDI